MALTLEQKLLVRATGLQPARDATASGADLHSLLAKPDDRLLADAGLTRREAMGESAYHWWLWSRDRTPWSL